MRYNDVRTRKVRELSPVETVILGEYKAMQHYTAQGLSRRQAHHRLARLALWIDEETYRLAAEHESVAVAA